MVRDLYVRFLGQYIAFQVQQIQFQNKLQGANVTKAQALFRLA